MAYSLSPLLKPRFFVNATNKPLVGGKLYTYLAETTTPATTYSNDTGTPNTNPIILDANGECNLYLDDDVSYRLILKDANDVTYFDKDRVSSIGGGDYKVLTFDTIADLRLKIGSEKEPTAQTSGYYAAGDGGGNSFYWDGASGATDNGGSIIKPTFVSGVGRWLACNPYSVNVMQFGAKFDLATPAQGAIQAALNSVAIAVSSVTTPVAVSGLGKTFVITANVQIPTNVILENCTILANSGSKILVGGASGADIHYYSGLRNVDVIGQTSAGVPVSTNLVDINYVYRGTFSEVVVVNALGAGIKSTINTRNCKWQNVYAYNCCQNVATITGAIEIKGSDHNVAGYVIGQATVTNAEIAAVSSQIQYRVGLLLNMSTATNGGSLRGEVSGFCGIYIQNSFNTEFGNLLADQNAGHGVYFATNCSGVSADVRGSDNNRLNGAYDTLTMADGTVGGYNIRSIYTDELGSIGNPMRFHFRNGGSTSVIDRGTIAHPRGRLNGATRFSFTAIAPSVIEGRHPFIPFTDGDTTPSVDGGTCFKFANTGATTITNFDDAYEGKQITLVGDGNTTLTHGVNIVCPMARNFLVKSGEAFTFQYSNSVWRCVTSIRELGVAITVDPPSIANGSSWSTTGTVSGASLGDVCRASFSLSLQELSLTSYVSAADTVTVVLNNNTGGAIDLGLGSFRVFVTKI